MINNYKQKQSRQFSIARLCMLLLLLSATSILYAQVSVTATSGTTGPTSYTTVNAAFAAITTGTHQGDIQITITANTTEPTFAAANQLVASGTGSANYSSITIKPQGDVVVNSAAAPTASRGMLEFIGADNITIDGDDPLTPGDRNLTFQMSSVATTYCSALRFSSSSTAAGTGCRNIIVKNCNITGSRNSSTATGVLGLGITAAGATNGTLASLITGAADNDNWLIENNYFKRLAYGFHAYGNTTNVMDSLTVRNNKFGNDTSLQNVGLAAIYLGYTALTANFGSAIVEGNEIQAGDYTTGIGTGSYGVFVNAGNSGLTIRKNYIHDVANPSSGGWQAHGITITSATANSGIKIHNNILRDMYAYHYSSGPTVYEGIGIYVAGALTNLSISHNTIALIKPNLGPISANNSSACVYLASTGITLSDFNNNILVNQQSDAAGQKCMAVYLSGAGIFSSSVGLINRNNYYVTGASGMAGYIAAAYPSLTSWKAITTKDSNSFDVNPPFISATNVRLQAGVKSALESNGAVTSLTTDIDGNVRPGPVGSIYGGGTAPDIGAHEADMLPDALSPDSVNATQVVQTIAPNDTSKAIMNVKVYVSGTIGAPFNLSAIHLNTQGTTVLADITNAKVFYTGNSNVFSTNELYGTVSAPNGSFTITGAKAVGAGVHNLWIAYDISGSAVSGNSADVRLDSVSIGSVHLKPLNGNPTGVVSISNPMTYLSSTTIQPIVSKVGQGTTNNTIIGVQVVTSATGAPISLTELNINLNGTTDTADIQNIKVWYTGTSNTFAANNQFGATVTNAPSTFSPFAISVTGNQTLTNGTNYFWVTYDIKGTAVLSNVVDGECTGITVAGTPQVPTLTAPVGDRQIRANYCIPAHAGTNFVTSLVFNNINHTLSAPVTPWYRLFPQSGNTTTSVLRGVNYNLTVGFQAATIGSIWIDFNDDGVFAPTEWVQLGTNSAGGTFTINIPCNAALGDVRMRIRTRGTGNANGATDACTNFGGGECVDYTITILDNPLSFGYVGTQQQTGIVAPGINNRVITRIPVRANGCGTAVLTEVHMNTTGTTNVSDIANAKLYRTIGATFNTTDLRQTVASPNGPFIFMLNDTLPFTNDTVNYWLAYDVSPSAASLNILDAVLDSIQLLGGYHLPANGNPAGNVTIISPMTYVSSTVTHPNTASVFLNDVNSQVLRLRVIMSSAGAPVDLTAIDVNLNGTTDTADIQNIKIWYTGASSTFAATTQFGSTVANAPATFAPFGFTVNGNQMLLNDTNYFWVTYDVKGTATPLYVIDGEITQITVAGITQLPTVTAPTGNRTIKVPHCSAGATNGGDTDIGRVQLLDASNNSIFSSGSATPTLNNILATGTYTNNTSVTPANLLRSGKYSIRVDQITSGGTFYAAGLIVYVDWNDDGDFADQDEQAYTSGATLTGPTGTAPTTTFLVGNLTVPCHAALGSLRMRVMLQEGISNTPSCGTFAWGEVEDYTINVLDNPLSFGSVGAQQQTGVVAPGALDKAILRIPVRANGCGTAVLTEVHMNTSGTTNVTDVTSAKLYRTVGSTFNTTDLRQTVFAPNGQFIFAITDTLPYTNDSVNYWLAYDINSGASFGNFVDARLDSIQILGNYQLPANGNPTGNVQINAPMTFVSATTTQTATSKVEQGSTNNQIIGVQVSMSASGSAVNLTELNINLNGTTDTADIQNIKVWYTGTSNTFATTNQFGTTVANAPATFAPFALAVTGNQTLSNGTNYFWITYDIKSTATVTNLVDAECTGITVGGSPQVPTIAAPNGNREIRVPTCTPTYSNACSSDDIINNVSTTGGTTNISNLNSGCNGNPNNFIYYPNQVVTVAQGATFTIDYQSGASWPQGFKIYIDYNNDGDFIDDGELVANAASSTLLNTSNITVPLNATLGNLRLRVRGVYGAEPVTACGNETYGETEDYNINVLPAPPPTTYVWNQTTPGSYVTPSNWTPARTTTNLNDILVFNGGGNVTVNNTITQTVSKLVVSNNTVVTLNGTADLTVADTLDLVSGRLNSGASVNPILGSSITNTGYLQGTGKVEGKLTRWFSATTGTYVFPLSKGIDSRSASITYSTAPTTAGKLEVRYITGAPGINGLPIIDGALTLDSISKDGIWRATASSGLAGGIFDIVVNADNIPGVNNFATTALVARADNSSAWFAVGTQVTTTGSNTAMVLSRTGLNAFGEVGIAGTLINPLPVKLINLNATTNGSDVLVSWTTASEVNNRGFNVERSIDGKTFEYVGFVKGAGNSSVTNNYRLQDANAFTTTGVSKLYYRLKQMDNDGKFEYSKVVTVENNESNAEAVITYPNPFSDKVTVELQNANAGTVKVEVLDISGRLVTTIEEVVSQGTQTIIVNGLSGLTQGIYFVRVTSSGVTQTSKLIKQ